MDLVEDFDARVRNFADLGGAAERYGTGAEAADEGGRLLEDAAGPSTSYDLPSLTLELSLRQAARCVSC